MHRTRVTSAILGALVFGATSASAQQPLPPLPPAAPGSGSSPPSPGTVPSNPAPPHPYPSSQGSGPTQPTAPNEGTVYETPIPPPPPPVHYEPPPEPVHAPKFSLWVGPRLGALGFGGFFFRNRFGEGETTGNFIKTGLAISGDIGARLGKRYIPYVFYERGFAGVGHRFEGDDASAVSELLGIGFRYIGGDVDSVGFVSDISVAMRGISVSNRGETFKMSSVEIFRLGLGAEIRLSTLLTISPMATISGGSMSDTEGKVTYSAGGSQDGLTSPDYQNGSVIKSQTTYLVVGLGCGVHFDVFGK